MPTRKPAAKKSRAKPARPRGERIGPDGFTARQRLFIAEYLHCLNGAEAARRAKYSAKTAAAMAWENLRKPEIRAAIDAGLLELGMGADEVLGRLADQARASMGDFFRKGRYGMKLDLKGAAAAGKLHLVKKYRLGIDSESIELHDAQAALVHLGRYHKLFVDRQEHTGKDGAPLIPVNRIEIVEPESAPETEQAGGQ